MYRIDEIADSSRTMAMNTTGMNVRDEVTRILDAINAGQPGAEALLLDLVENELKRIAKSKLNAADDCSLSPTEMINEAYIKLFGNSAPTNWNGPGHFFGSAASAMRQIIVDHARRKRRQKRGGELLALDLDLANLEKLQRFTVDQLLEFDEALEMLSAEDPELRRLVELRFFTGQTVEEVAELLGISVSTADRNWRYARARLQVLMK